MFDGNAQSLRLVHSLHELNLTLGQLAALCKYRSSPCRACTIHRAMVSTTAGPASAASSSANNPSIVPSARAWGWPRGAVIRWSTSWRRRTTSLLYRRSEDAVDRRILTQIELLAALREADEGGYMADLLDEALASGRGSSPIFASI